VQEFSVPALIELAPDAALPDIVRENAATRPDAIGFARPADDGWEEVTNTQFLAEVEALAKGFMASGIGPGDRVAVMSRTRYEWTLCDFALWTAGAVPVPVYDSSAADQARWILSDSGAVACIVESPRHRKVIDAVRADLPELAHLWVITDGDLDAVAAGGEGIDDGALAERRAALTQDSLATVIYTSGTTGRPKGCELTHGNFLNTSANCIRMLPDVVGVPGASTLLFLPLAHVFARLIQVLCVQGHVTLAHTPTITDLAGKLQSFGPTFLLAVPRVFEKVYTGAQQKAHAAGKGSIFDKATDVAIAYSRAKESGRPNPWLAIQHALFDRLVYSKLRAAMGGNVRYAVSGGAPLGERLGHYFNGIGIMILEGYGLTETTAPATVNAPTALRIGTVGRPIPGCTIRIDDDGEVLVRGPHVFHGYRGDAAQTSEVLDTTTGWYRTGDLGRLEDGYLRITGRKKEIIVTAGGKNVAPAPLEHIVRAHPLVSQVVVVGDDRPYVGALVTLDAEALRPWLLEQGREVEGELDLANYVDDADIRSAVQTSVDAANTTVSAAEAIKRWAILPVDFTEESGHLTPKLSIKRNVVIKEFGERIEDLYV
jgi:long-chain acyl-CoA synthetase